TDFVSARVDTPHNRWDHGRVRTLKERPMSDPTTPATPEEPTSGADAAPETPVVPEPAAAEPASPAVASDPLHAAQTDAPSANPYVAPGAPEAPAAPAANPYAAPAAAGYAPAEPVKQTLSLVSFIIGIIS